MSKETQHNADDFSGLAGLFGIEKSQLSALVQLASIELSSGAIEQAIETLTVLTDLDPFCAQGWLLLSRAHQHKGNAELAQVYREFAEGIAP